MGDYVADGYGSIRALIDEEGTITDSYSYDAFGNVLTKEGDTENDYRYTGEEYNELTGLYYLRARYMNPSTGTFISADSYAGRIHDPVTLHKYLYANPVKYVDPSGYNVSLADKIGAAAILCVLVGGGTIGTIRIYTMLSSMMREVVEWKNSLSGYLWDFFHKSAKKNPQGTPDDSRNANDEAEGQAGDGSAKDKSGEEGKREFKKPVKGKSGKEAANDVPDCARGNAPYKDENGIDFAKRLMDEKYGAGNYKPKSQTEYSQIHKWGDRGFE